MIVGRRFHHRRFGQHLGAGRRARRGAGAGGVAGYLFDPQPVSDVGACGDVALAGRAPDRGAVFTGVVALGPAVFVAGRFLAPAAFEGTQRLSGLGGALERRSGQRGRHHAGNQFGGGRVGDARAGRVGGGFLEGDLVSDIHAPQHVGGFGGSPDRVAVLAFVVAALPLVGVVLDFARPRRGVGVSVALCSGVPVTVGRVWASGGGRRRGGHHFGGGRGGRLARSHVVVGGFADLELVADVFGGDRVGRFFGTRDRVAVLPGAVAAQPLPRAPVGGVRPGAFHGRQRLALFDGARDRRRSAVDGRGRRRDLEGVGGDDFKAAGVFGPLLYLDPQSDVCRRLVTYVSPVTGSFSLLAFCTVIAAQVAPTPSLLAPLQRIPLVFERRRRVFPGALVHRQRVVLPRPFRSASAARPGGEGGFGFFVFGQDQFRLGHRHAGSGGVFGFHFDRDRVRDVLGLDFIGFARRWAFAGRDRFTFAAEFFAGPASPLPSQRSH